MSVTNVKLSNVFHLKMLPQYLQSLGKWLETINFPNICGKVFKLFKTQVGKAVWRKLMCFPLPSGGLPFPLFLSPPLLGQPRAQ